MSHTVTSYALHFDSAPHRHDANSALPPASYHCLGGARGSLADKAIGLCALVNMILLDEVEDDLQLPAKLHTHAGPTLRRPDSPHSFTSSRTFGGLPDYDSSQAQLHPEYGARASFPLSPRKKRGCLGRGNVKEGRRFRKAVGVALLIYFAITIVISVPIVVWVSVLYRSGQPPTLTIISFRRFAEGDTLSSRGFGDLPPIVAIQLLYRLGGRRNFRRQ